MTWKVGDIVNLPLVLQTIAGRALTYASLAAFLADGWALEYMQAGVAITAPAITSLIPDPGLAAKPVFAGEHLLTLALPSPGGATIISAIPSNPAYVQFSFEIVVPVADTDSIAAQLNSTVGAQVAGGTVTTVADLQIVEGDCVQAQYTVPLSALQIFDLTNKLVFAYTSLADLGGQPWTIAAQARYLTENGELPSAAVAFTFQAAITDKVNSRIAIGWSPNSAVPTGAIIDDLLPTAPTVTVGSGNILSVVGGLGGHFYGTNVPTVTITGGSGTGGILTPTIVNGAITAWTITNAGTGYASPPTVALAVSSDGTVQSRTFAFDVQLVPPTGSTYQTSKLTVIRGSVIILRQQTTSP